MSEVVDQFETPAMPLGSFPAIFSQALSLGVLSRRRVYQEALQVMAASTPLSRLIGGTSLAALQTNIAPALQTNVAPASE